MAKMCKLIVSCLLICEGVMALLQIDISPPVKTTVGNNTVEIKCSITRDDEFITSFTITAFNRNTTTYEVIASFFSVQKPQPVFTKYGKYLEGRASLIANTTYDAIMLIHEVQCGDDNKYACVVNFLKDNTGVNEESNKTALIVGSDSRKPDSLTSDSNLTETESGQNVTLTCKGNIGNPPGKFVWKKYLHNSSSPIFISDVNTISTEVPNNCSFYGTSNLTVQLTDQDNLAVFACVEESHLSTSDMEIQTQSLNVYYPVKNVTISRNPFKEDYIQGVDNEVNLNCNADGNPMPHDFLWYKEEDMLHNLTTENIFTLNNLSVNDSGTFICVAFNSIGDEKYNSSDKTELSVLATERTTIPPTDSSSDLTQTEKDLNFTEGTSASPTSDAQDQESLIIIIVTVVVVCVLVVPLIAVVCYYIRRGKGKSVLSVENDQIQRSTGVSGSHTNNGADLGLSDGYSTIPYDDNQPLVSSSKSKPLNDNYTEIDLPGQRNEQSMEMSNTRSTEDKLEDTKKPTGGESVGVEYATVQKRPNIQDQQNESSDNSKSSVPEEVVSVDKNKLKEKEEPAKTKQSTFLDKQDKDNENTKVEDSAQTGNYENPIIIPKSESDVRNSLKGLDEYIDELDKKKGHDNEGYEEVLISEEKKTKEDDASVKKGDTQKGQDVEDNTGNENEANESSIMNMTSF